MYANQKMSAAGQMQRSCSSAKSTVTRPAVSRRSVCVTCLKSSEQEPSKQESHTQPVQINYPDPEAKFRRYGSNFGGVYQLTEELMKSVPRVRVRTAASRQVDQLQDLAVLNERLAGSQGWEARQKLEYLKTKRKNWEAIYNYVTKQDAAATLAVIEEASRKVEEALSEEARERSSVSTLKEQLVELQKEVDEASQRLNLTQARVEQNLQRVDELKAEAAALERLKTLSTPPSVKPDSPLQTIVSSSPGPVPKPKPAKGGRSIRDRGLQSSLEMEDALRNYWYPAEFSTVLKKDTLIPFELFGEPWVLFRDEHGSPSCIRDQCAHRACPLSIGKVVDGEVQCPYHGWQFNADGACTKMPSTIFCKGVKVSALPCVEKDGFIWVWPGLGVPPQVPEFTMPPKGFVIHSELMLEVPVEHGLLIENLLDLAHAPFTHTTTFARGWPIPDFVKFHANKMLSGQWDPYPIEMGFKPPCCTVSLIGLAQPGKIERGVSAENCERHLHQLHVCMPSRKGHTRLLYRMSLDFMPWVQHVPFIDKLWMQVAKQVLGEDLVLVAGQQDRMQKGGDTWAHPVSYDKLAVRYRRWRNAIATGTDMESASAQLGETMNSGEMFRVEEETFVDMIAAKQQLEEVEQR